MKLIKRLFRKSRDKWELITNHWELDEDSRAHHFEEVIVSENSGHRK